jgi:hypothetical protein
MLTRLSTLHRGEPDRRGTGGRPERHPRRSPSPHLRLLPPGPPPAARVALTLRTLGGLATEGIASAFLVPAAAMAPRLVRFGTQGVIHRARHEGRAGPARGGESPAAGTGGSWRGSGTACSFVTGSPTRRLSSSARLVGLACRASRESASKSPVMRVSMGGAGCCAEAGFRPSGPWVHRVRVDDGRQLRRHDVT